MKYVFHRKTHLNKIWTCHLNNIGTELAGWPSWRLFIVVTGEIIAIDDQKDAFFWRFSYRKNRKNDFDLIVHKGFSKHSKQVFLIEHRWWCSDGCQNDKYGHRRFLTRRKIKLENGKVFITWYAVAHVNMAYVDIKDCQHRNAGNPN